MFTVWEIVFLYLVTKTVMAAVRIHLTNVTVHMLLDVLELIICTDRQIAAFLKWFHKQKRRQLCYVLLQCNSNQKGRSSVRRVPLEKLPLRNTSVYICVFVCKCVITHFPSVNDCVCLCMCPFTLFVCKVIKRLKIALCMCACVWRNTVGYSATVTVNICHVKAKHGKFSPPLCSMCVSYGSV